MATLTIRNIDDDLKTELRVRAARRGWSMEEEARRILKAALREDGEAAGNLADGFAAIFDPLGGVNLDIPAREPMREPPDFSGPDYDAYDRPGYKHSF
ncbi:plasmid stabilization protein [Chelatococcus sambhunathii]|uniref:Plasmid stabilization protein n=1 Tax=Chelatococcus sambhunathii TaxID=363953 RepID=A0ABU1DFF3_9HYPH|nr:plasmid stabilization protein [Chelatococcus sambhunathii]MDR4306858.1 plasmid stabilization protein [Chelatococcus sambhunathii]